MRSIRNVKRFLALALALLMVMAACALAMFAPLSLTVVNKTAEPVALLVGLVVLAIVCMVCAGALAQSGTRMAPKSRGDPNKGLDGVPVDQMMSEHNGLGAFKDVRRKAWRPPKTTGSGGECYASISCSSTQTRPPGESHQTKAGINVYAFNSRDRNHSGLPALMSVLEVCMEKVRGSAAAFKKACSDLFSSDPLSDVRLQI